MIDIKRLLEMKKYIPLYKLLRENKEVYASIAPSIVGQFGENISMGQLRTAFRKIGFEEMIEVALFADILTIKEAYEFDKLVNSKEDFYLTSCCCPIWIKMVEKSYPDLFKHMSLSVSPMIASGRFMKRIYSGSKIVFFSPCTAKKVESRDPRVEDAIDLVITYRELNEIFSLLNIDLNNLSEDNINQASFAGRTYARTGGVSLSVKTVVNRIAPDRVISLKAKRIDGIKECKEVLDYLKRGKKIEENFIEGMGCAGGCVGGPETNIDVNEATRIVNEYSEESYIMTPMDNANIIDILEKMGLKDFSDVYYNEEIKDLLTRKKLK